MAAAVWSDLAGNFKDVFASKYSKILPSFAILQEDLPYKTAAKTGEQYSQAVLTRRSHGFTYLAPQAGLVTLNSIIPTKMVEAKLQGSQIIGRDGIEYESAFASVGGKQAFKPGMKLVVESLWESHRHRLEADVLYGQTNLGVVSGAPAANVITLTTASWAPGLWVGMEGAELEIFSADGTTQRAGIGAASQYTIVSVDLDARTITVDDDQNVADTDVIQFRGAFTESGGGGSYSNMAGVIKWLTNTGTIANISASTYNTWKANSVSAGSGPFSFDLVLQGTAKASVKGQMGRMKAYCHPQAFANAISDLSAAVRRPSNEVKKYELGAEAITFHTGSGTVEIVAHPMMKEGLCPVLSMASGEDDNDKQGGAFFRLGAQDMTFVAPYVAGPAPLDDTGFFWQIPDTNGLEIRTYSHQAVFSPKPGRSFIVTGIVNDV